MRILVLGGGVIGVTAAYALMKEGHEVTVIDRNAGAAEETSFANAGLIAPGHAYAWASPRAPKILFKSLYRDNQALRFRPSADPRLWAWSLRFLRECTAERARINTQRKHRLCLYSQRAFEELVTETGVAYDGEAGGLLYLYRQAESFDKAAAKIEVLTEGGQALEVIDADRAAQIDPALAPVKEKFSGAIYCPSDASGDAHLFTRALGDLCADQGVMFAYDTAVERIEVSGSRVDQVVTTRGRYDADAYVFALGAQSAIVARTIGITLPIYPIKGYSATVPVAGRGNPPRIGGVDEDNLTAYCRMGDRLRVTATAEFSGYDNSHKPSDFEGMLAIAKDLFPEGGDFEQPSYWACLRPMTPRGAPIFGRARYDNLYLNVGHGHMGWTMAAGSARITADLIAGRTPEIPLEGMTLQ